MLRDIAVCGITYRVDSGSHADYWDRIESGAIEPETFQSLRGILKQDDVYLDCGAFIGSTALFAASLCKDVLAVEADPVNYVELVDNIEANGETGPRVKAFQIAIADRTGQLSFGSPDHAGSTRSSLAFAGVGDSWAVDAYTLPDFMTLNGIDRIDVIKMDIEGAEYDVIPGCKAFLKKNKPTLILGLHPHLLHLQTFGIKNRLKRFFIRWGLFPYWLARHMLRTTKIAIPIVHYKYVFLTDGRRLSILGLFNPLRFRRPYEIIATDRPLKISS